MGDERGGHRAELRPRAAALSNAESRAGCQAARSLTGATERHEARDLADGTPDGRLVVVSHDLTRCSDARHVAPHAARRRSTPGTRPRRELELIARSIEAGGQPVERFHERDARAPLPRADERGERSRRSRASAASRPQSRSRRPPSSNALRRRASAEQPARRCCAAVGAGGATLAPVASAPDELGAARGSPSSCTAIPPTRARARDAASAQLGRAASDHPLVAGAAPTARRVVLRLRRHRRRIDDPRRAGRSIFGAIERTAVRAR